MKPVVTIARILVGVLFIFSGLVKAIDPLGLAYKMQEFFEVWASEGFLKNLMMWLYDQAVWFAVFMITLEVILGVALLLGWRIKAVTRMLLLLMLFFTFLTTYVLFSGKIRACGCFGDCIPLTPVQTFSKDVVLLVLIILILFNTHYIKPLFRGILNSALLSLSLIAVLGLQWYVLSHLPVKDCLPFKPGNNILELRKMPPDAVPDKYNYVFVYEKDKVKKEFTRIDSLPDSTWQFIKREQVLSEKGKNNIPLINDFTLVTAAGTDSTEAILSDPGEYYLLFTRDVKLLPAKWTEDKRVILGLAEKGKKVLVVTSQRNTAAQRYGTLSSGGKTFNIPVLTCDITAIKTAARNDITLYRMQGAVIKQKWGGNDIVKAIE